MDLKGLNTLKTFIVLTLLLSVIEVIRLAKTIIKSNLFQLS